MTNEMWQEAVKLLDSMVYSKSTQAGARHYALKDRIRFLTLGLVCANKVIEQQRYGEISEGPLGSIQVDSDYIFKLRVHIELAELQLEIYEALVNKLDDLAEKKARRSGAESKRMATRASSSDASSGRKEVEMRDYLSRLDKGLYDINELYDTALKLRLWECCLSILKFSNSKTPHVVKRIWKNIICEQINKALKGDGSWREQVLEALPRRFVKSPEVFPLAYICGLLEEYNNKYIRDNSDPELTLKLFRELRVPLRDQIQAYTQLMGETHRGREVVNTVERIARGAIDRKGNELEENAAGLLTLLSTAEVKTSTDAMMKSLVELKQQIQRLLG
eukprot:CAMPEP_0197535760 /NCGR_PEP_ID=MMETSP1318-20131121/51627_1 /TAXON_ID=552666 /ORGANISM="Partenskyella glossopodia, Strain RCC365" /LENGTH=333 /DNA_ID=CAMNT_0043093437 /DNA_START=135 /DNA_END=1136 /DNA_ORIENTATION=-